VLVGYVGDVETTGLDPKINDIIEVSFWRLSDNVQRSWFIKAINEEDIDDAALQINKHKKEDILGLSKIGREKYQDPSEVVMEIEEWMMGDEAQVEERAFIGVNPDFDIGFLKAHWEKVGCSDSFPFGRFVLDLIQTTRFIDFCKGRRRQRYNLGSMIKDFKIKKDSAHRADGDVRMTKDLLNKQVGIVKEVFADLFNDCYGDK